MEDLRLKQLQQCAIHDVSGKYNINNIDFCSATKIYFGLDRSCRCGCNGVYAYKKENPELFDTYVNEIKRLRLVLGMGCGDHINIPIGNNKAYTVYYR